MVTFGEKYVERVEKALCETVALAHTRQMPMTVDDCFAKIRNLGFSSRVDRGFVEDCYQRLDREGHVEKENERYRITDDGRQDLQQLEHVLRSVVGEIGGPVGATRTSPPTGAMGGMGGTSGGRPPR